MNDWNTEVSRLLLKALAGPFYGSSVLTDKRNLEYYCIPSNRMASLMEDKIKVALRLLLSRIAVKVETAFPRQL